MEGLLCDPELGACKLSAREILCLCSSTLVDAATRCSMWLVLPVSRAGPCIGLCLRNDICLLHPALA
jgi:hypothetical protein